MTLCTCQVLVHHGIVVNPCRDQSELVALLYIFITGALPSVIRPRGGAPLRRRAGHSEPHLGPQVVRDTFPNERFEKATRLVRELLGVGGRKLIRQTRVHIESTVLSFSVSNFEKPGCAFIKPGSSLHRPTSERFGFFLYLSHLRGQARGDDCFSRCKWRVAR